MAEKSKNSAKVKDGLPDTGDIREGQYQFRKHKGGISLFYKNDGEIFSVKLKSLREGI